jgi:hypothetical protein
VTLTIPPALCALLLTLRIRRKRPFVGSDEAFALWVLERGAAKLVTEGKPPPTVKEARLSILAGDAETSADARAQALSALQEGGAHVKGGRGSRGKRRPVAERL